MNQKIRKFLGFIILISLSFLIGHNIRRIRNSYGFEWGYTYPVFAQAKFDLTCPAGTQPFQPLITTNPQSGNLKANACIDPTGTVTYQGGIGFLSIPGFVDGKDFLLTDSLHGQIITDGSWANGSSTLNSAGMAQWTSALINPNIVVFATNNCRTGAGVLDTEGVRVPLGTITSVNSPTQIVVSTVSTAVQASGGCIIIGQRQDTGMANISNAVNTNTVICQTVKIPAGIFLTSLIPNFLSSQPTACANNGLVQGQEPGGLGGFLVQGQGSNSSVIVILPDLLPTACINGTGNNACYVIPGGGTWSYFRITGVGQSLNGRADGTKSALQVGSYASFDHMVFDLWGTGDTGFVGVNEAQSSGGLNWVFESLIDSFGAIPFANSGTGNIYLRNSTIQNGCGGAELQISTASFLVSEGGNIIQLSPNCSVNPNRSAVSITGGGGFLSVADTIQLQQGGANSNGLFVDSTSTATLRNSSVINLIAGAGEFGIHNQGKVSLQSSFVNVTGGGQAIFNEATGTIFEDIRNTVANGTINNAGKWIGSSASALLVVGNLVPSANFGTGATVSAPTGNVQNFTFTLTNGSAAVGANPTIAFTFPNAQLVPFARCSLWQVGGTQAITALTEFLAPSGLSSTSVTFTYNGTPTINLTEFYQGSCGN